MINRDSFVPIKVYFVAQNIYCIIVYANIVEHKSIGSSTSSLKGIVCGALYGIFFSLGGIVGCYLWMCSTLVSTYLTSLVAMFIIESNEASSVVGRTIRA